MAPGITIRVVRIRDKVGGRRNRRGASDLARRPAGFNGQAGLGRGRRARPGGTDRCGRLRVDEFGVRDRLRRRSSDAGQALTTHGDPVVGTCASAVRALRLLDAQRMR
jgi:hypothetical protein